MRSMPLSRWLLEQQRQGATVDDSLRQLLETVGRACQRIAYAVRQGPLAGLIGEVGNQNVQGESQKILDVIANDTLLEVGGWTGTLCGMASEEMEHPHDVPDHSPKGGYLLLFDPLDGSSNIDVNVSIGTIFSVLHAPEHAQSRTTDSDDYLQPGNQQVAAGYAVYGPSAILILTLGKGVAQFILDAATGDWILTADNMQIPADTKEYAVNASNARHWEAPVKRYFDELQAGKTGPLGKDYNMRWVGSMVAEVHRIMTRGGIFMYPKDAREPGKAGKLRLMYEANPMAMLVEQAGGAATNGMTRILDIPPEELHQRCAVFLGSRNQVKDAVKRFKPPVKPRPVAYDRQC